MIAPAAPPSPTPESGAASSSHPAASSPPPASSSPAPTSQQAARAESIHLSVGVLGALAGLLVGVLALRGTAPLAGAGSIGQVAALAVFGCATATSAVVLVTRTLAALPWYGSRRVWRRVLDVVGLSLLHGLLGLLLTGALFTVVQQAFQGVALDRAAGTVWVAATSAAAAYITSASVSSLTARSLATLLAVFLTVGVLASAMYAPDPYWWERYFSELGEGSGAARAKCCSRASATKYSNCRNITPLLHHVPAAKGQLALEDGSAGAPAAARPRTCAGCLPPRPPPG